MWLPTLEALRIEYAAWTARNRLCADEYHRDPFAGTRALNRLDEAAARMRASRAEKEGR